MAGAGENLATEPPIYIQTLQTQRREWRTAARADAHHRHPVQLREIWNDIGNVPDTPPATLLLDNDTWPAAPPLYLRLRVGLPLVPVPGTTSKFQAVAPGDLEFAIPPMLGQVSPIPAGSAAPALAGAPSTGYAPVLTDAAGTLIPFDPNVWVVDGLYRHIEFPYGVPATLVAPFAITYFRYEGIWGGAGAAPASIHIWRHESAVGNWINPNPAHVDYDAAEDFLFGGPPFPVVPSTEWAGGAAEHKIVFDYSQQGAFRAGRVTSFQWDHSGANLNRGLSSAAFGEDTTASGDQSLAYGVSSTASGLVSVAGGDTGVASGTRSVVVGGLTNTASGLRSAVVGGSGNTASNDEAFVGGGLNNTASNTQATVIGGLNNTASGTQATVGGGLGNVASGLSSTVGGGFSSTASGGVGTVGGGSTNTASAVGATVAGGRTNIVGGADSTIGGGTGNQVPDINSVVAGGSGNTMRAGFSPNSAIGGGNGCRVESQFCVVGGGNANTITDGGGAPLGAHIGGGWTNLITGTAGILWADSISGGFGNSVTDGGYAFLGGGQGNAVTAGGSHGVLGGGNSNTVSAAWATLGGGQSNSAGGSHSGVLGGQNNSAAGAWTIVCGGQDNATNLNSHIFIGGGSSNSVNGGSAAICGGTSNSIPVAGVTAFIGAGTGNIAGGSRCVIGGGEQNNASGSHGTIGGGFQNIVAGPAQAFVGGGFINSATGRRSVVVGGGRNTTAADYSVIGGGGGNLGADANTITAGAVNSTIAGGHNGSIGAGGSYSTIGGGTTNTCDGFASVVAGGTGNTLNLSSSCVISGGSGNTVAAGLNFAALGGGQGNTISASQGTIAGGIANSAAAAYATVGGGQSNSATGAHGTVSGGRNCLAGAQFASVGGGDNNDISQDYGTIGGGLDNIVSGLYATVGGGRGNTASATGAWAGGIGSTANQLNSFVWSDGTAARTSGNANEVVFGASGGFRIYGNGAGVPAYAAGDIYLDSTNTVVTGKLTVTGVIDPSGLVFTEQAAVPQVPLVTEGTLWVWDNGAGTNILVFTDGAGGVHYISGSGTSTGVWHYDSSGAPAVMRPDPTDPVYDLTADFVFGSTSLDDTGVSARDARFLFDKSQGSFRAGSANGAEWDAANRGNFSVAFGLNTQARGDQSVVGGGALNVTNSGCSWSTIGGGVGNAIAVNRSYSTIGGGWGNAIDHTQCTIGGGQDNSANGQWSTVPGGQGNTASGTHSWAGGNGSTASHANSFVWSDGAPRSSTAVNQATFGAAGGFRVLAGGAAGALITLDGPVTMPGKLTVGGVVDPTGLVFTEQAVNPQAPLVSEGALWVFDNGAGTNILAFTDGAGSITYLSGGAAVHPLERIVDAVGNSVRYNPSFPGYSTGDDFVFPIATTEGAGSRFMFDSSTGAFRAGIANAAQWDFGSRGMNSVAFGVDNTASGAQCTIGGGQGNSATGQWSTVPGGQGNTAGGVHSWAGGDGSTASHANSFVWSDGAFRSSTAVNQATFGAAGGFRVLAGGAAGALITLDGPVTMPGKLTVGGVVDPTGLVFAEQAVNPQAPLATEGALWVFDNGAGTNLLAFTDGAGSTTYLSGGGPVVHPLERIVDAVGNSVRYNPSFPGYSTGDDFVFPIATTEGAGSRFMFDSSTGAFRAGVANAAQWDLGSRGVNSVAFGINNTASGAQSVASGGTGNTVAGQYATVGGGNANTASAIAGTVGGGQGNVASNLDAVVAGGSTNTAVGDKSAVCGGLSNTAAGTYSFVGGGNGNTCGGFNGVIGGGAGNNIGSSSTCVIAGGSGNTIGVGLNFVVIGGGQGNSASASQATVGGGQVNTASADNSTVGGGGINSATGQWATVSGGLGNTAGGQWATVPGGQGNLAGGTHSWAGGDVSTASHANSFVWSDGTPRSSTAVNQATFGAAGGFRVLAGGAAGALITLDGPVTMPGKLTVGGVVDPTGLVFTEQAANPQAPLATEGALWVFDNGGGTNILRFTDGAGGITDLSGGGPVVHPLERIVDAVGNSVRYNPAFPGYSTGDDFVFPIATTEGAGSRFMFDSSTGAFRAGVANAAQWDLGSRGVNSVAFGVDNTASGAQSVISGGTGNSAAGQWATVGGGSTNTAFGGAGTVGGGGNNQAGGVYDAVGGGSTNITGGGGYETISGGLSNNLVGSGGQYNTIGGGNGNFINGGQRGTISGGQLNSIGPAAGVSAAAIGGGYSNSVNGTNSTIGGGYNNSIGASANRSTIPGGSDNVANGSESFCAGNTASDGGFNNCFVWCDVTAGLTATAGNQFMARSIGGFSFYTAVGLGSGATLPSGLSAWAAVSDRNMKENLVALDPAVALAKVEQLPIYSYNFKGQDPAIVCRGPVAQEWHELFPSKKDPLRIDTMDLDGVTLAAVKGLAALARKQAATIESQTETIGSLVSRVETLERLVTAA